MSERSSSDQQVVSATGTARAPGICEQRCMRSRHTKVVRLDWNRHENVFDERAPSLSALASGELNTDQQFGGCDRRDHHVVFIVDDRVQRPRRALGRDEDGRVEYQPVQCRSSMARAARSSRSSAAHRRSGGLARRISLMSLPFAARAGSTRATAWPRRTMRKLSPRRSTASSSSEKRRAASVAVSLRTKSDYQILRRLSLCGLSGRGR